MDIPTAIILLTVNVTVLSVVIVLLLIVAIILIIKLNKVASNAQQITTNVAHITEWFSPVKVFTEITKAIGSLKKR
jgi:hypothetical protein